MRQYEIWWAELPKPAGRSPVLLLSRDDAYGYLNKVVVVEITTTVRGIPVEVAVGTREGLPQSCVANCDNIRTVARSALSKRAGSLSAGRRGELKRAVGFAFGWPELIDCAERR